MNRRLKSSASFFIVLFLLFFIIIIPSLIPVQTLTQKQETQQHNNEVSQQATVASIFNNNLIIAIISFIPFVGWGYLLAALWNTGVVVASYSQPWYNLFLNPFAWIELYTFTYILFQSWKIVHLIPQRKANDFKVTLIKLICKTLIVITLILLFSAMLEYAIIRTVWI